MQIVNIWISLHVKLMSKEIMINLKKKKARGDTILGCRDPFNMIMRKAGGEFLVR